ncbi:related to diphthamide synthesis protein DPH2 [Cephalotrichum gorgonifer]|uniref:2-(3-amino-3-carboxypropyl)histidine synthase subunit 2 n=1 Tax=Cephalotrichum gorgonifer TaxID=2041049 RepID=A0AAE8MYQ1_9PEZI|nr:related to diphthamide synthesis protein DPH2 [Cephalotrichum gorgonifer]
MADLVSAPVLSTPAEYILEPAEIPSSADLPPRRPDDELRAIYEIERTAREIRAGGWGRVALQFPDSMLGDVAWVVGALKAELDTDVVGEDAQAPASERRVSPKLYVLADTSYSACCVDEIAAEHVNAQVAVHYGRSCLSPTARLPVIYIFTRYPLDHDAVVRDVEATFPEKETKIIVIADVTYQDHVPAICELLLAQGYKNILSTDVIHDPSGTIPNRKLVRPGGASDENEDLSSVDLTTYSGFHISTPPTSLLLALHSRLSTLHIHPTSSTADEAPNTAGLLRRRFARVLSLATAGTIGILVNTLSVANYLSSIQVLRQRIAAAGKKSYTIVVGKLNPAKLANFAEIEGWVVVGCWESGLVEDDRAYYQPIVTPFELEVALMDEDERVWGAEWWGGIEGLSIEDGTKDTGKTEESGRADGSGESGLEAQVEVEGGVDDDESPPPEFDLRTGKLVSRSRPMREAASSSSPGGATSALVKRDTAGELATINGVVSTGAEFLRSQRTWQGLGTDFTDEESTVVEEGRRGVARGYVVGEDPTRT